MNWYKKSQEDFGSIVVNEYGEESYKWPKGWSCSVKKEKDGLYWSALRLEGNLVQSFPGDYASQSRKAAFEWLQWYLKGGKNQMQ